jgi:prephenate dehydrogenase
MIGPMVVGVYGLGRFGSFWAKQLVSRFTVVGWSRDPERPTPPGVSRVSEDEVLGADVLVLCVAISAIESVLKKIAGRLRPGSLVMDTCSVKVHPSTAMMRLLPPDVEILATHPMFGPDSGKDGLKGLPFVFCPLRISGERADYWRSEFSSMGLRVVEMTPDEHDREAAYSQGITHFIGRVLGELKLNESSIGTTGYRDLLDIVHQTCNDPWRLFVDLQQFNPYTIPMREDLHKAINTMLRKFDSINVPQLED